ncbi:hypothetical protein OIA45_40500 (plasmid) [Streptomyces chartreusis]|uniref:hypothetical protein n=1 Tax=Streptomyces TaxID=1883 RepID=UPI002F9197FF|nr:hypothetical protein OIA45_40500 [Streptomyces chartreusis]
MNNAPVPRPATAAPACGCGAAGRFGPTHALILLVAVLGLGSGLFLAGTQLSIVFALLGGLGAIGAATLTAAGGGRRLVTVLIEAAVRSSAGR